MVSIKKYTQKKCNEWDLFVEKSKNGTLFHKQKFLSYHLDRSFNNCSLIIEKNNRVVALLPAVIFINKNKKTLHSHPGASFGGLVYNENMCFELMNEIFEAIDVYCYNKKIHSIIIINMPCLYYQPFNESEQYLLFWNKYNVIERYISHVVNLNHKIEIVDLLSKRKKRYLQKDNNGGFNFQISTKLDLFYPLLLQSKKSFKTLPTHSLDELKKLTKTFPSNFELLLSSDKDCVVGGSFLIYLNSKICLVFYNVIDKKYRKTQLSTYQLYQCMKRGQKRGCVYVDFGVSQTPENPSNPLAPKMSLIKFKEQFGALGVMRSVYKKEFIYDK